jgi:hypothetical protein
MKTIRIIRLAIAIVIIGLLAMTKNKGENLQNQNVHMVQMEKP